MRRFIASLLFLSGMLAPHLAQAQGAPSAPRGLRVRVHVFSGRPDPEFRITDPAEIARITALLKAHAQEDPAAGTEDVITHKLGYRGISILPEGGVPGLEGVSAFAVNHGRIQVHRTVNGAARSTHHRDDAAELEGFLLARGQAQGHLETKVIQRIQGR